MKLSIIIPVFNCSAYLTETFKCISQQQNCKLGSDYEAIFINDGSTDDSLKILRTFESKGVTVINKLNGGVSSARNVGLAQASGEYVWFIDGDDCINSNSVSLLLQIMGSCYADAYTFRYKHVPEDYKSENNLYETINRCDNIKLGHILTPWLLVIKRDFLLLHNIQFKERVSYGEDTMWITFISAYSLKVVGIRNVLYYYRQRPQSAVHTINEKTKLMRLNSIKMIILSYKDALINKDVEMTSEGLNMIRMRMYWNIQNLLLWGIQNKQYMKEILDFLNSEELRNYPILWDRLFKSGSLGEFKINVLCTLFPYNWYYKFISYIL